MDCGDKRLRSVSSARYIPVSKPSSENIEQFPNIVGRMDLVNLDVDGVQSSDNSSVFNFTELCF